MPEAMEDEVNVMRCVLLCMLEAADDGLCLLEVLEVVRGVPVCMLKAGCLREAMEVLEVMCRVCSALWRPWRMGSIC